jgi:hypothetical protein
MISEDRAPVADDDFGLSKEKADPYNLKMRVTDQVVSEVVSAVKRQGNKK